MNFTRAIAVLRGIAGPEDYEAVAVWLHECRRRTTRVFGPDPETGQRVPISGNQPTAILRDEVAMDLTADLTPGPVTWKWTEPEWLKLDPKDPTTWPNPDTEIFAGRYIGRDWSWSKFPGMSPYWWGVTINWEHRFTHWLPISAHLAAGPGLTAEHRPVHRPYLDRPEKCRCGEPWPCPTLLKEVGHGG